MKDSGMWNEVSNHVTLTFGDPNIIPYTKFEHFGIICF